MNLNKTIFTGFASNLVSKDVKTACRYLFNPKKWKGWQVGENATKVEVWLKKYFNINNVATFDSGRTSLLYALKALGVQEGDEVIVQAYTCIVVINAIKFSGATPIYVDIDEYLNIDVADLYKKMTPKTKVVIVQHTFGVPAKMNHILEAAKNRNIKVLEDCAHSLGATYEGKKVGTLGDIAILSFGSDKIVSCNRGGAVLTNDNNLFAKVSEFKTRLPQTPRIKIIQHLFHFPIFFVGKKLYSYGIGKIILYISKKLNITNKIIYEPEKKCKQVIFYPAQLPNCLADILLSQLEDLDELNQHRIAVVQRYNEKLTTSAVQLPRFMTGAVYLRYNILTDKPDILRYLGKKKNILFGDWYNTVVAPKDSDLECAGYKLGSCPQAEKYAFQSINLPTDRNILSADVERIVKIVNEI